ncbi:sucrase ferredoxin [Streptomyces albofaciens JCM 4342]|uniref:sucrase ferredoxin n=1 Tax=Streptomyces albofaciens TaxID=66866 RepID=UPI00123A47A5|nr:sucrase ferredoxin [Streptomyces albofaciens]KAA6213538.1 sucrase ferredoxin [Streptomyces albofaciens JCM 4342]
MSTCATASRDAAEPVAGTSATARTWLLVEQTGPWGTEALTESHLDPRVGRALEAAADGTGVRVALIRRPGRHADCHGSTARRAFVAHTAPGRSWMRTAAITDPEALLSLDFARLGAGEHDGLWAPYAGEPLVFVCTNGKRDRCCALLGRPLAAELAVSGTEAWEVTHIGGHRFSPTLFVLPYGYAYGRASAPLVKDAVESARSGRILLDHCRGRSAWERPAQAADLAVRELIREDRADALDVVRTEAVPPSGADRGEAGAGPEGPNGKRAADKGTAPATAPDPPDSPASPAWVVTLAHRDGRSWQVTVEQRADGAPAPASCGSPLGRPARMAVVSVRALPHQCLTLSRRS